MDDRPTHVFPLSAQLTYTKRLIDHVEASSLQEKTFFGSYQVFRNVWHMLASPESRLFLMPRANKRLWNELARTQAVLRPATRERIVVVAIEDVLARIGADPQCPAVLREYSTHLQRKYVIGVL